LNDDFDAVFGTRGRPAPKFTDRVAPRQPDLAPPPRSEDMPGVGPYKPYGFMPAGVGEGCDVQRWLEGTEIAEGIEFQYRFLMQIGYVGEEQIKLFLPDCIIVIEGRHLHDLRKKLARRMVTFIQQYNPRVWSASPEGGPFIEFIQVVRPEELTSRG